MEKNTVIDYKSLYYDMISRKYPERIKEFSDFFSKQQLNDLDILQISRELAEYTDIERQNAPHKSYSEDTIIHILNIQKKYHLTNTEISKRFKISRNTISNWRKHFRII